MIKLDGTPNKSKLGANAILAVSMAVARAAAALKNIPFYLYLAQLAGNNKIVLPVPAFNVINGGQHAGNKLPFQEFMILPIGASSFKEAMKIGSEVYHHLKAVIKKRFGLDATSVGDEGGFAPNILDARDALELIKHALEVSGHTDKVQIGLDVAASEMYKADAKKYDLDFKNPASDPASWITSAQLGDVYKQLAKEYGIVSIEDPFDQDDWEAWTALTTSVDFQVVG